MNLQLLYYRDLQKLGYGSRPTIWRKVNAGTFPQPVIHDGRPAWKEQDLIDYYKSLKAAVVV